MGEDQSSLEKRLFRLMKQYEQPVNPSLSERLNKFSGKTPLLRSKKLKYSGHLPYTGEIMTNHGPTLSERVSDFLNQHWRKIIIGAVVLPATSCCLTVYALSRPEPGPGEVIDQGEKYVLYYKEPALFSDFPAGVYISDVDGSNYRLLAENRSPWEWKQAELSPNEKRAALVEATSVLNPSCELWVINTKDGSRLAQLTDVESFKCDHDPFPIDDSTVGFVRRKDGVGQYMQVSFDKNNVLYGEGPYDP